VSPSGGHSVVSYRRQRQCRIQFCLQRYKKGKGKAHPRTGNEGPERVHQYSCTVSLTSVLDWGGWSTTNTGSLTRGKQTQYALYRTVGGPQGRSARVPIISPPTGIRSWTVYLVATRFTDYADKIVCLCVCVCVCV
jgi:hypothetical protein